MKVKALATLSFILLATITGCMGVQIDPKNLHGSIVKTSKGEVTIHTFIAPEDSWLVTSHIIETANALVIVDPQLMTPLAKQLLEYAESLGKPVDRLIITHAHSDHIMGSAQFKDFDIYSDPDTRSIIEKEGRRNIDRLMPFYGDKLISRMVVVPNRMVSDGEKAVIDGLPYEFRIIKGAEDSHQLVISLPSEKICIAQDLLYNRAHIFLGEGEAALDGWIAAAVELKESTSAFDFFLAGHGPPTAERSIFDENIGYLEFAKTEFAATLGIKDKKLRADRITANLSAKYPDYGAKALLAGVYFTLAVIPY